MTKQFIYDRISMSLSFSSDAIDRSQLNLCSLVHLPKKETFALLSLLHLQ